MKIHDLSLPEDWSYFSHGNSNVLFKYQKKNKLFENKLLRIRSYKSNEEYISTIQIKKEHDKYFNTIFYDEFLDYKLVEVSNFFIKNLDSNYIPLNTNEKFGFLIDNLIDDSYEQIYLSKYCQFYYDKNCFLSNVYSPFMFHFKPKWLYNNYDSKYCRNCLNNQFRGFKRHFCPLDFLQKETIDNVINDILSFMNSDFLKKIECVYPITQIFKLYLNDNNNIFQKLKNHQNTNINNLDEKTNTSIKMTLRDSGLFLNFIKIDPSRDNCDVNDKNYHKIKNLGIFDVRPYIYDLDKKSVHKYEIWKQKDDELRNFSRSLYSNWKFCHKKTK